MGRCAGRTHERAATSAPGPRGARPSILRAPRPRGEIGARAPRNIYFYTHRPRAAQRLLYCLDPNRLAADGSATVHGVFPCPVGRLVAYKVSRNNADDARLHILDLETGRDLADVLDGARYAAPQWTPDGRGFYYVGLPSDPDIPAADLPGRAEVRFHRVGESAAHDEVVAPATHDASCLVEVGVSHDGHWLLVSRHHGWNSTDVHVCDLHAERRELRPLVVGQPALYKVVAWRERFYVLGAWEAPDADRAHDMTGRTTRLANHAADRRGARPERAAKQLRAAGGQR